VDAVRQARQRVRDGLAEFIRPGTIGASGRSLWVIGRVVLTTLVIGINIIGIVAVLASAYLLVPLPYIKDRDHVGAVNAVTAGVYIVFALVTGQVLGTRSLFQVRDWLRSERAPTDQEKRVVMFAPLRLAFVQLGLWLGAAVVFGVINSRYSVALGGSVATTVAITGLVTSGCTYLISERIMRVPAGRALVDGAPDAIFTPGVTTRSVLAWALGSGLPVFGLVAIGIVALSGGSATRDGLAAAIVSLGAISLTVGLLAVSLAARATAAPVDSVRRALERVRSGDFDVRIPVYDTTQIGKLQLGFNEMVAGLAERERIRALFGTYVDPDVVTHLLDQSTSTAGEEVEVTIMFVDVRDFTSFAESTPAPDVLAALNQVFEAIVPFVHQHGGSVDKFVGDGLMAVFGARQRLADHADRALAAALAIDDGINRGPSRLRVGIGLNSGTVVAGNVGGAGRLDFSVIGDAVNVAARVEAATRETGDAILLTERTRELIGESGVRMEERLGLALKGKTATVRIFAPSTG
jgi:adenylate cyclase